MVLMPSRIIIIQNGHAEAQYRIGLMYYNGNGVEKNHAEAERWFSLAAEQNNEDALKSLEFMRLQAGVKSGDLDPHKHYTQTPWSINYFYNDTKTTITGFSLYSNVAISNAPISHLEIVVMKNQGRFSTWGRCSTKSLYGFPNQF